MTVPQREDQPDGWRTQPPASSGAGAYRGPSPYGPPPGHGGQPPYAGRPPYHGSYPYGPGPYGRAMPQYLPPQQPQPAPRHGRTFGVLVAVVATVATAIGIGAAELGRTQPSLAGPGMHSGGSVQPVDSQSVPQSLDAAVQKVVPGIVLVNTEVTMPAQGGGYQDGEGAGTGIVLTSDGSILTNNHVVEGATTISVTDVGNGRTYGATVTGYDRTDDLAVIHLTGASGLAVAPLGNSDDVGPGDSIVGVGNAGGNGSPIAAPGTVTATGKSITASDDSSGSKEQLTGLIQVAADIQPGDSGGPLVNKNGEVVGIDTAASQGFRMGTGGGEGFAIPINKGIKIAQQIQAGTASDTVHIGDSGVLGVSVQSSRSGGAQVTDLKRGPAYNAGLRPGDLITALDNQQIDTATALTTIMDQHHPGDTVTLQWTNALGTHQAQVTLDKGPVG